MPDDSSFLRFQCGNCRKRLKIDPRHAGRSLKCSRCSGQVMAPGVYRPEVVPDEPEVIEDVEVVEDTQAPSPVRKKKKKKRAKKRREGFFERIEGDDFWKLLAATAAVQLVSMSIGVFFNIGGLTPALAASAAGYLFSLFWYYKILVGLEGFAGLVVSFLPILNLLQLIRCIDFLWRPLVYSFSVLLGFFVPLLALLSWIGLRA